LLQLAVACYGSAVAAPAVLAAPLAHRFCRFRRNQGFYRWQEIVKYFLGLLLALGCLPPPEVRVRPTDDGKFTYKSVG